MNSPDYNQFEYDVFLSYSSIDKELVRKLKDNLYHLGLEVFSSDISLDGNIGNMFFTEISNALERSKLFLLVASKNSMGSTWVQLEYQNFINVCYVKNPNDRKLIILKDSGLPVEDLPILLRSFQITESINVVSRYIFDNKAVNISRSSSIPNFNIKDLLEKLEVNINIEKEGFITIGIGGLIDKEFLNSVTGKSTESRASRISKLLATKLQKLGEHKLAKQVERTSIVILLIKGENSNTKEPVYAYLALKLTKLEEFMAAKDEEPFYPQDYGEIIYSGTGSPPPKIKMEMERKYGYDHDNQIWL